MNREVQVRFCEGLGVKFPGPTRHSRPGQPRLQVHYFRFASISGRELTAFLTVAKCQNRTHAPQQTTCLVHRLFDHLVGDGK
jgi:hypothetical protein